MTEPRLTRAQAEVIAEELLAGERQVRRPLAMHPIARLLRAVTWCRCGAGALYGNEPSIESPASPLYHIFHRDTDTFK